MKNFDKFLAIYRNKCKKLLVEGQLHWKIEGKLSIFKKTQFIDL